MYENPVLRDFKRNVYGPQTRKPPHPAVQVLGCLAKCERIQVSRSFALLKQVRWWEEPVLGWDYEYRLLRVWDFDRGFAEYAVSFLFV